MKKAVFLTLLLLVVAVYVGYRNPRVRAWFEHKSRQVLPASASEQTMYRWRDKHGEWHVSDKPPHGGIHYDTLHYPTNANVIPSAELTGKK
jgi:hypothetical protein